MDFLKIRSFFLLLVVLIAISDISTGGVTASHVVGGKKFEMESYVGGVWKPLLIFQVENSPIDADDYTISAERDDQVGRFYAGVVVSIEYLPVRVAEKFPNLLLYQVNYCSVKEIRRENFENLRKLVELNLENNKISSIGENSLSQLISLKKLHLAGNQIKSLNENLFQQNAKLEEISFERNQLQSLPAKLLSALVELNTIDFRENKLTTIDKNFFSNNRKLDDIRLQDNQIERLHGDLFRGLSQLKHVDLRRNKCIDKEYAEYYGSPINMLISHVTGLCSQ